MDIEEAENRLFQLKQSMELLDLVTGKPIEEDTKLNIKAIETVLSELEKIVSKKQYEKTKKTLKGIINKQNKEIKKKDKIIDEMAIFINNFDIDEDICKNQIGKFCKNEDYEVTASTCCKCIEQYFTKKVEGK